MRKRDDNLSRATSVVSGGTWIHFIATTYGAWLSGDPRGFRTRHHREHVAGDYKNPPPRDLYAKQIERSLQSLKQPPVQLATRWRPIVGVAVREKLGERGAFVLCLAVSSQHVHVLARLPRGAEPRIVMGLAKKHAAFEVKERSWTGKLWGRRGKELRVRGREHQLRVYGYILAHAKQGAWLWHWRMKDEAGGG